MTETGLHNKLMPQPLNLYYFFLFFHAGICFFYYGTMIAFFTRQTNAYGNSFFSLQSSPVGVLSACPAFGGGWGASRSVVWTASRCIPAYKAGMHRRVPVMVTCSEAGS